MKSSNFHVKPNLKLGLLSEGSAISLCSAMEGRGISMSYTSSESLTPRLITPIFVTILHEVWTFLIRIGIFRQKQMRFNKFYWNLSSGTKKLIFVIKNSEISNGSSAGHWLSRKLSKVDRKQFKSHQNTLKFNIFKKLIKYQGKILKFPKISEGCINFFDLRFHTILGFNPFVNWRQNNFPKILLEFKERLIIYTIKCSSPPNYQRSQSSEPKFIRHMKGVQTFFTYCMTKSIENILKVCKSRHFESLF
jgi:hypothetical protein